jgi:hypothetical protein
MDVQVIITYVYLPHVVGPGYRAEHSADCNGSKGDTEGVFANGGKVFHRCLLEDVWLKVEVDTAPLPPERLSGA